MSDYASLIRPKGKQTGRMVIRPSDALPFDFNDHFDLNRNPKR